MPSLWDSVWPYSWICSQDQKDWQTDSADTIGLDRLVTGCLISVVCESVLMAFNVQTTRLQNRRTVLKTTRRELLPSRREPLNRISPPYNFNTKSFHQLSSFQAFMLQKRSRQQTDLLFIVSFLRVIRWISVRGVSVRSYFFNHYVPYVRFVVCQSGAFWTNS